MTKIDIVSQIGVNRRNFIKQVLVKNTSANLAGISSLLAFFGAGYYYAKNFTPIGELLQTEKDSANAMARRDDLILTLGEYVTSIPLQSTFQGRIGRVYVGTPNSNFDGTKDLVNVLNSLFPEVILCSDIDGFENNKRIKNKLKYFWARDIAFYSSNGDLVLGPVYGKPTNKENQDLPTFIESMLLEKEKLRLFPVPVDGGGVLSIGDKLVISRHNFDFLGAGKNIVYVNDSFPETLDNKNDSCKVPVSRLFKGHVDMYITPTSDTNLLIADNNWGLEILSNLNETELKDYTESIKYIYSKLRDVDSYSAFFKRFNEFRKKRITKESNLLDRIADELSQNFTIKRIPSVIVNPENRELRSLCLPYNNSLLESTDIRKIVVMPTFQISALDEESKKVFESEGYTVHTVPMATGLFKAGIHCATLEKRDLSYKLIK